MSEDEKVQKIIEYLEILSGFTSEIDENDFYNDRKLMFATSFCICMVSNISKEISVEYRDSLNGVNWDDLLYATKLFMKDDEIVDDAMLWKCANNLSTQTYFDLLKVIAKGL